MQILYISIISKKRQHKIIMLVYCWLSRTIINITYEFIPKLMSTLLDNTNKSHIVIIYRNTIHLQSEKVEGFLWNISHGPMRQIKFYEALVIHYHLDT